MAISAPDTVSTDVKRGPSLMIKISNLSKSFSGQTVLDHLDLDIQKRRSSDLVHLELEINLSS